MSVYVDDMYKHPIGQFRGMKMSHMIADTHSELMKMARRIGVQAKWLQQPDNFGEHFDICLSKRAVAIVCGAKPISMRELAAKCDARRGEDGKRRYFRR